MTDTLLPTAGGLFLFFHITPINMAACGYPSIDRPAVYAGNRTFLKENDMSRDQIPEFVQLREERTWVADWDSSRHADSEGQWMPYKNKPDERLEAIIAMADGNRTEALKGWYQAAKPNLRKKRGIHLIPGRLQEFLRLPVRQVYIHHDAVYRIEADGRVTLHLL
jgi:hypothetical protein